MNSENQKLLERLIKDRLEKALSNQENVSDGAFDEAMKAIDVQLKVDDSNNVKVKNEHELRRDRLKYHHELMVLSEKQSHETAENNKIRDLEDRKISCSKSDKTKDRIIKCLEIASSIAVLHISGKFKKDFAKMLCEFEKDYSFTTTAGRSLSSIFKFK